MPTITICYYYQRLRLGLNGPRGDVTPTKLLLAEWIQIIICYRVQRRVQAMVNSAIRQSTDKYRSIMMVINSSAIVASRISFVLLSFVLQCQCDTYTFSFTFPLISSLALVASRRWVVIWNPLVKLHRLAVLPSPNINLLSMCSTREGSRNRSSTRPSSGCLMRQRF